MSPVRLGPQLRTPPPTPLTQSSQCPQLAMSPEMLCPPSHQYKATEYLKIPYSYSGVL